MTNEELVKEYQEGNKQALEELLEANKYLLLKFVNKFYTNTSALDIEDLEQEARIGLIIAAKKYDSNNPQKAKFSTYSVNWIYQRLSCAVLGGSSRNKGNTELNNNCTSLNTPIGENGEAELGDIVEDRHNYYENIDERLYLCQLRRDLERVMLDNNTLREREVLKLKYGWDLKPMTDIEIGELLNTSSQNIHGIRYKGLRKIRRCKYIRLNSRYFVNNGYCTSYKDYEDCKTPEQIIAKVDLDQ